MTQDDVIQFAVEADLWDINDATEGNGPAELWGSLERFAALVAARAAADEREKTAKLFDNHSIWDEEVASLIRSQP